MADGTFEDLQGISHEASLEGIFTHLTSDGRQQDTANAFLETIET